MFDFPITTNADLEGPYRLTLQEFNDQLVSYDQLQRRHAIQWLEQKIADMDSPDILTADSVPVVHRHTKGIYTREMTMPEGIIVGKRHAQEHIVMMTAGWCTVFTERGCEDLYAPCTFTSPAGEKRVFFVHEAVTMTTIHRTDAETLEEIEADLILPERYPDSINKTKRIEEN